MKSYQIAELEQLSGIKAHTIRIWEKRYNLIEPDRTDSNIRRYNDKQVRKLLNVSTLLSSGLKISKIALLKESELHEKIVEFQSKDNLHSISYSFINELTAAMLNFNEVAFEKTFSAAVTRFGMFESMVQVFYPFLLKTGMMWVVDSAIPVQEHFASSIIRRKLMAAIDGLPLATQSHKKFLLLLPPQEWHDVGLLFSNYIIRSKGFETIYLGQDVPYENIVHVIKHCHPNYVLSFFVARKNPDELKNIRKKMNIPKETKFLVAGNQEITDILEHEKNTKILKSPGDLLKFL